ncbi:OLC1v1012863C1 [Oldenlandia corymbosa var. corymbosa]|uniref:OLC1v1012863C1 n=1 Tax=Oldenlandia corymbosa var. corymbosa TaxID=529605 RepID=A0AAV1DX49_OLDCO|nr:OLC1v1012863C1 [Oldenlandia corymbosa var. corymbosa]
MCGFRPKLEDFKGNKIYASSLKEELKLALPKNLPDDDEAYDKRAQVWAWEHIPKILPIQNIVPFTDIIDPKAPLTHRWNYSFSYANVPKGCLPPIRDQLALIRDDDKDCKGTGKLGMEWKAYHSDVNPHWDNRSSYVVEGEEVTEGLPPQAVTGYLPWFHKKTVIVISDSKKYGYGSQGYQSISERKILYADTLNDIYHIVDEYRTKYPTRDRELNTMIDSVLSSSFIALTIGPDALKMVSSKRLVENQPTLSQHPLPPQKKAPKKNIGGGRKIRMPRPLQTDYGQSSTDWRIVPFHDPKESTGKKDKRRKRATKKARKRAKKRLLPLLKDPPKKRNHGGWALGSVQKPNCILRLEFYWKRNILSFILNLLRIWILPCNLNFFRVWSLNL